MRVCVCIIVKMITKRESDFEKMRLTMQCISKDDG